MVVKGERESTRHQRIRRPGSPVVTSGLPPATSTQRRLHAKIHSTRIPRTAITSLHISCPSQWTGLNLPCQIPLRISLEFERAIFEMAALARRTAIPILMSVAARVKACISFFAQSFVLYSSPAPFSTPPSFTNSAFPKFRPRANPPLPQPLRPRSPMAGTAHAKSCIDLRYAPPPSPARSAHKMSTHPRGNNQIYGNGGGGGIYGGGGGGNGDLRTMSRRAWAHSADDLRALPPPVLIPSPLHNQSHKNPVPSPASSTPSPRPPAIRLRRIRAARQHEHQLRRKGWPLSVDAGHGAQWDAPRAHADADAHQHADGQHDDVLPAPARQLAPGRHPRRANAAVLLPAEAHGFRKKRKERPECGHYLLQALNKQEMRKWLDTTNRVTQTDAKRRLTCLGNPKPQLADHLHDPVAAPRNPLTVFGVDLNYLPCRESGTDDVPPGTTPSLMEIETRSCSSLYADRLAGAASTIAAPKEAFNRGEDPIDSSTDIHAVCDLVESWFRMLPEPVFPSNSYQLAIDTMQLENLDDRLCSTRHVVQGLPRPKFDLLKRVSEHFDRVADFEDQNQMTNESLAIVFGPNLLRAPQDNFTVILANMVHTHKLVKMLITHFHVVFDESDVEAEGEGGENEELDEGEEQELEQEEDEILRSDSPTHLEDVAEDDSENAGEDCHPPSRPTLTRAHWVSVHVMPNAVKSLPFSLDLLIPVIFIRIHHARTLYIYPGTLFLSLLGSL
ncbi:hypothetical protein K438DRAFT_1768988 [Mycena galopus ATCC 62051]|nr:hypothetical protein K438DRAFT_1768988 [Mycena galopus ATCC 62051]